MLNLMKNLIIASKLQGLNSDFAQAGQSLKRLAGQLETLQHIDPHTAWQLVLGLQASLEVAEKTLRETRRSQGLPDGPVRAAVTDLLTAVSHARALFHDDLLPLAEKTYGFAPKGTRWKVTPPDSSGSK